MSWLVNPIINLFSENYNSEEEELGHIIRFMVFANFTCVFGYLVYKTIL